jgi:hypothetical protein
MPGRIEDHALPLQVQNVPGGDDATVGGTRGRHELEHHVDRRRTRRHVDVEGVRLDGVALPGDGLIRRADVEPSKKSELCACRD